mmetsp:Transcript_153/g.350  ORF Transcript_153/g.350 Transcript_153/m.350 type:complete len:214 (+) Transcript_153:116-757(+)
MNLSHAGGWSSTDGSANVARSLLILVEFSGGSHNTGHNIVVWAHVLGFLLGPNHFGVGEASAILRHAIKRKRSKLFQAYQCYITLAALLAFRQQFVVDLARAKHQCLDRGWVFGDFGIVLINHALEFSTRPHLFQRTNASLMAQQILGGGNNEGLAEVTMDLTTQAMEKVGGRCAIHNLHVTTLDLTTFILGHSWDVMRVFINLLQESFQTAR